MERIDAMDAFENAMNHYIDSVVFPQIEHESKNGEFSTKLGIFKTQWYAEALADRIGKYGYDTKVTNFHVDWFVTVSWGDVYGKHAVADKKVEDKSANDDHVPCVPSVDKCTWCVFGAECPDSKFPHKDKVLAEKYKDMAQNIYADLQQICQYGIGNGFDWYAEYSVSKYYGIYFGEPHVVKCTKPNHKLELEFICYKMGKDWNVWEPHVRVVIERKERPDSYGPVFGSVDVYPANDIGTVRVPMYSDTKK